MMADPSRLESLIAVLNDVHVSVVWNAAKELAKLGTEARPALPALSEKLRSHDATTALWARYAIAKITGETEKHLPALIEALDDKRVYPGMAATALAGFGASAANSIPSLIPKLGDAHTDNRWSAAWALASIGPQAKAAVPALAEMLTGDRDEKARWYAAYALSEIGTEARDAVPALLAALDDTDDDVRGYAVRALGRIGREAANALPRLLAMQDDENETLRAETLAALSRIQTQ